MDDNRRYKTVKAWFNRGNTYKDPFDKFFALWITLIVSSNQYFSKAKAFKNTNNISVKPKDRLKEEYPSDRELVLYYFNNIHRDEIFDIINSNPETMKKLAERRGTEYNTPIVDSRSPSLQEKFSKLSKRSGKTHSKEEDVDAFGELLNIIRNNLFHGHKIYDDAQDIELLNLLNPMMIDILRICEFNIFPKNNDANI